jgi:hypothetical protein
MDWVEVESSNIKAVAYNEEAKELLVEFHSGGTYTYFDVDKDIYDKFLASDSKGKFFHKYVRNNYSYERL